MIRIQEGCQIVHHFCRALWCLSEHSAGKWLLAFCPREGNGFGLLKDPHFQLILQLVLLPFYLPLCISRPIRDPALKEASDGAGFLSRDHLLRPPPAALREEEELPLHLLCLLLVLLVFPLRLSGRGKTAILQLLQQLHSRFTGWSSVSKVNFCFRRCFRCRFRYCSRFLVTDRRHRSWHYSRRMMMRTLVSCLVLQLLLPPWPPMLLRLPMLLSSALLDSKTSAAPSPVSLTPALPKPSEIIFSFLRSFSSYYSWAGASFRRPCRCRYGSGQRPSPKDRQVLQELGQKRTSPLLPLIPEE